MSKIFKKIKINRSKNVPVAMATMAHVTMKYQVYTGMPTTRLRIHAACAACAHGTGSHRVFFTTLLNKNTA